MGQNVAQPARPRPGDIDSRRPYTNVSTVAGNEPLGNANYNGLQVRMDKRFSAGLSILAGYTWSKAITDTQGAETGAFVPDLQDNNNRRANRGLWAADTRHRFTFSSVYELPFGNRKRFLVRRQWSAGESSFWMAVRRHLHLPVGPTSYGHFAF